MGVPFRRLPAGTWRNPVLFQQFRRLHEGFSIEHDPASGTGWPVRHHDRSSILPGVTGSVLQRPIVLFLAFLGAGVRLEAEREELPPFLRPAVEGVEMPACLAIRAVTAFNAARYEGVFHF